MPIAIIIEGPNKVGKTALVQRFKSVAHIFTLKFPDLSQEFDSLPSDEDEETEERQIPLESDEDFLESLQVTDWGYKEYPGQEMPLPGFNGDDDGDEAVRHRLAFPLFRQLLEMSVAVTEKPFILFDRLPSITTKVYFGNVTAYINEITLEMFKAHKITQIYVVLMLPEKPFEEDPELEEYYNGGFEDVKAGYESLSALWAKKFLNAQLIKTRNWLEALEAVERIIEEHEKD